MRVRRIALMMVAKLAVAVALMRPTARRGSVEYLAPVPLPGLQPEAPVVLLGMLIGHVSHLTRRGDTTVLRLRFQPGVDDLPGSLTVQLRPFGLEDRVALEMLPMPRDKGRSFVRGGLLEVRLWEEPPPELSRMPRFIPPSVPAPRVASHISA
jgi:hypothetical protein